MQQTATEI